MQRSPCATCDRLGASKNTRRCAACERRLGYLAMIERGPECRSDPSYDGAYFLPRTFARQLGPATPFSQMDLMLTF